MPGPKSPKIPNIVYWVPNFKAVFSWMVDRSNGIPNWIIFECDDQVWSRLNLELGWAVVYLHIVSTLNSFNVKIIINYACAVKGRGGTWGFPQAGGCGERSKLKNWSHSEKRPTNNSHRAAEKYETSLAWWHQQWKVVYCLLHGNEQFVVARLFVLLAPFNSAV